MEYSNNNDVISFSALFNSLWYRKWTIMTITVMFAVGSVVFALKQTDIYKAQVIVVTPSGQAGGGGLGGQLGNLAGLAGISIGGSGSKSLEQVEDLLRSRSFLQHVIEKHDMTKDLIAAIGWDRLSDKVIYDPNLYDEKSGKWIRVPPPFKNVEPSAWEAYPVLLSKIETQVFFKKDMLKLTVEHFSPSLAKSWATILIEELNAKFREKKMQEAKGSIEYIENVLTSTRFSEVRQVFYKLLEEQIKNDMLAKVRKEYAFETLSPALVPEDKSSPKRGLICIIGTLIGGVIAIIFALILNIIHPPRED